MESATLGAEGSRRRFPVRALFFLALIDLVEKTSTVVISTNLITYLMTEQFYGVKKAAILTNTWGGINTFTIAVGAIIAHIYMGRPRIAIITPLSLTYIVGLIILSMGEFIPGLQACKQPGCDHVQHTVLFFCSIAAIFIASGVIRAYVGSVGRAQLDDHHYKKWWEMLMTFMLFLLSVGIGYVLRYWLWGYTFIVLLVSMAVATGLFYRGRGLFYQIDVPPQRPNVTGGTNWSMLSILWVTCMVFGLYKAQTPTLFMLQGGSMNRVVGHGKELPTIVFVSISTMVAELSVCLYQKFTKREGTTTLQRTNIDIVLGMFLTMVGMLIGALVERKRLEAIGHTEEGSSVYGPIKMNAFWLLPQGVLLSIADGVILSGATEQFKLHVPHSSSDLATAFHMSAIAAGSFFSNIFIEVAYRTKKCFRADVDHSHIDRFYWILFSFILLYLVVFHRFFVSIQIRAAME